MFDVIGIGACAADYLGIVPSYPLLDERVRMLELHRQGGGEAATALVTLSRLGVKTSFVGKIGDDEAGKFIIAEFEKEKVDTSHMVIEKGGSSLFAFSIIERNSAKRTLLFHKDMKPLNPKKLSKEFILSAKILHLDQHEPEASIQAATWFKKAGKVVVLDIDVINSRLEKLVRLVDVVIGSESFARSITCDNDFFAVARKIASLGPKVVVITLGDRGCLCKIGKNIFIQPAFQVDAVDTTGCGDVFHGAFIYGLLQKWDYRRIATFSNAVAAIKSTKVGGRDGIPGLSDLNKFLERAKLKE